MAAIYVRYKKRYWRLSALFRAHGVSPSAGYRKHKALGCPTVYKDWMLVQGEQVAVPIELTIDGVKYPSIKAANEVLGLPKNRLPRRVKKYGTTLTMEQIQNVDPSWNGISNLNKKKEAPSDEWKALSNKRNTGAARRPSDEWLAFTDRPRAQSHTPY